MSGAVYQLWAGDVRAVAAGLPPAAVQTIITSIPYYGLRVYGTDLQVWGGRPDCAHTWVSEGVKVLKPKRDHAGRDFGPTRNQEPARKGSSGTIPLGATCSTCGAWLGELGQEPTPDLYVAHVVDVFAALWPVLAADGTLWLNIGDSYSHDTKWGGYSGGTPKQDSRTVGYNRARQTTGLGDKQLLLIPARIALALQADGWLLRQEIIWNKPNAMPESVQDRCTRSHEVIYQFAKQGRYYYNAAAIAEPAVSDHGSGNGYSRPERISYLDRDGTAKGSDRPWTKAELRNKRDVWTVNTEPYPAAHFATFPPALIAPCILAGSRPGDVVLDPFVGSGTTVAEAIRWGRVGWGIDLQADYLGLAEARIQGVTPPLFVEAPPPVPRPVTLPLFAEDVA